MSDTRKMAGLTWILCEPPVSEQVIDDHERVLGVKFPDDFRSLIQWCPGGQPLEREDFWIEHPAHGRLGSGLGSLVTLGPADDVDGMLWSAHALHTNHGVPREVIPIGMDGGGDFICFDYRGNATHPSVVYYSHEAPAEESLGYVADSLTSFLAMLEPPDDGSGDFD